MLPLGEVMASFAVGEVIESEHREFAKGELVSGVFGWQDYAVSDGKGFGGGLIPPQKIPPGVDIPTAMSLFGNGLTSYFGLLDVGQPNAGDTVLVSAAAGAVGSIVCQIANLKGCRVVGIANGQRKCDWLRDELGVDAIDYKDEDVQARLAELCPNGVNVFFDSVGGEILDAGLASIAPRARIVICGVMSAMNDFEERPGIRNHVRLLRRRASMRGFLIFEPSCRRWCTELGEPYPARPSHTDRAGAEHAVVAARWAGIPGALHSSTSRLPSGRGRGGNGGQHKKRLDPKPRMLGRHARPLSPRR